MPKRYNKGGRTFLITFAKQGAWSDLFLYPKRPKKHHEQHEQHEQPFKINDLRQPKTRTHPENHEQPFKINDLSLLTTLLTWLSCLTWFDPVR